MSNEQNFDLATPEGLRQACARIDRAAKNRARITDGIYCPGCGDWRVVVLELRHWGDWNGYGPTNPVLAGLSCFQCKLDGSALLCDGPAGDDLVIVWPKAAGLSTPNTPTAVGYYLDQAARSESVGARSAATAMYRAALEQLLYEQGFDTGMLNAKITALEAAINNNSSTTPAWARRLEPDFLKVIKDLGNGAIHPNGGDISKQDALDADLLRHVHATMHELLDLVYEEPRRRAERLAALRSAANVVK